MFSAYFTVFLIALELVSISAHAEEFMVSRVKVNDLKAVYATVESRNTLLARARIGGTIGTVEINEGDAVKKGQVLAIVGDRKLAIRIEASSARVQSARATWNSARIDLKRATALYGNGTIPKARMDTAKTAFNVADHTLAAMIKERDVIVQQAREGAVLAPADGRILKVKATDGEVILPGEVVAVMAIYLLVVGLFGSFKTPLVILLPIPLSLIGIIFGHWLFSAPFTAPSMIGFIALDGIIVRNSILLVDFINHRRADGAALREALLEAGATRFKPIFLTAMAAITGSAFILNDPIFQGLAISMVFGLISSTALTLLVIPALYMSLRDDGRGLADGRG